MSLSIKNVLLILGGLHHDFEGFRAWASPVLAAAGCQVEATYDLDRLLSLDASTRLVLSYTSLSRHREGMNDTSPELLTDEQIAGLRSWVSQGGGLLSVHSGTVAGKSAPAFGELMGGVFIEHPPQFTFTVYPLSRSHAITAGVGAFTVQDEFYMQRLVSPVDVHMVAIDRGVAHPMVWSRSEGAGRVAHIAMGHSGLVWELPLFHRLFLQAADWVTGE
jgi:uncharacterized protein